VGYADLADIVEEGGLFDQPQLIVVDAEAGGGTFHGHTPGRPVQARASGMARRSRPAFLPICWNAIAAPSIAITGATSSSRRDGRTVQSQRLRRPPSAAARASDA
jgi:hypothetical protein